VALVPFSRCFSSGAIPGFLRSVAMIPKFWLRHFPLFLLLLTDSNNRALSQETSGYFYNPLFIKGIYESSLTACHKRINPVFRLDCFNFFQYSGEKW
jgi:hypothetical protein